MFIIDRDLFAGLDVTQRDEENVIIKDLHERVGRARVVDVMSAVAAATSIETPATIHLADPQHLPVRASTRFAVADLLARVLRDLVSSFKGNGGEAASAVDRRRLNG